MVVVVVVVVVVVTRTVSYSCPLLVHFCMSVESMLLFNGFVELSFGFTAVRNCCETVKLK